MVHRCETLEDSKTILACFLLSPWPVPSRVSVAQSSQRVQSHGSLWEIHITFLFSFITTNSLISRCFLLLPFDPRHPLNGSRVLHQLFVPSQLIDRSKASFVSASRNVTLVRTIVFLQMCPIRCQLVSRLKGPSVIGLISCTTTGTRQPRALWIILNNS